MSLPTNQFIHDMSYTHFIDAVTYMADIAVTFYDFDVYKPTYEDLSLASYNLACWFASRTNTGVEVEQVFDALQLSTWKNYETRRKLVEEFLVELSS